MSLEDFTRIPIKEYLTNKKPLPVYKVKVSPTFCPIDINIQFILEEGWGQADRLRFHFEKKLKIRNGSSVKFLFNLKPHILIRQYGREEDSFVVIFIVFGSRSKY